MNEAMRPGPVDLSIRMRRQLSIVVPTFNELDNVAALYRKLAAPLTGTAWHSVSGAQTPPPRTPDVVRAVTAEDRRVPARQGEEMVEALKKAGKTDFEYISYPGEGHSWRKVETILDFQQRMQTFLAGWVLER